MPPSESLDHEEYRQLRATIRERGTLRLIVVVITFVAWATLAVVLEAPVSPAWLATLPLFVLAAGFEVTFAAHVGVERIGRYVLARYETPASEQAPAWERVAGRIGRERGAAMTVDPLFSWLFATAAAANLILPLVGRLRPWMAAAPSALAGLCLLHALFLARVLWARRAVRGQRARDLALIERALTVRE